MTTICRDCRHFIERSPIWYDQLCGAVECDKAVNPVTGEEMYAASNDVGQIYFHDRQFEYARKINTGACEYFYTEREQGE